MLSDTGLGENIYSIFGITFFFSVINYFYFIFSHTYLMESNAKQIA